MGWWWLGRGSVEVPDEEQLTVTGSSSIRQSWSAAAGL